MLKVEMKGGEDARGGCESFEHTADVGLRVWAPSPEELFERAALGLIELMLDPACVRAERTVPVEVEGHDAEDLLVAWLQELLYRFEAERFAPARAEVDALARGALKGRLVGETFDPARHRVRQHVKAVTYHDLAIVRRAGLWEVRVVLDV